MLTLVYSDNITNDIEANNGLGETYTYQICLITAPAPGQRILAVFTNLQKLIQIKS